jgi:L-threonylcarbamoyladenylate synthase
MSDRRRWPDSPDEQVRVARRAAEIIAGGGLVVYPTDTVYGLGCAPHDADAIRRIYAVKGRPDEKAIIWLVGSLEDARQWVEIDESAEKLAQRFWPGGLSLILRRSRPQPGELPTLGVRSPAHPAALAIIEAAGGIVATTSANRSGEPSARTAAEADAAIGSLVDLIVDAGPAPGGTESTVLDISGPTPVILRPGATTAADLEAVLGAKLA